MDLQSILDASDSSEDAEHDVPAYKYSDGSSNNMDLEQILREDEEDDDDDEDHRLKVLETTNDRYSVNEDYAKDYRKASHNAEEWAVLQAILGADDDDETEEDWLSTLNISTEAANLHNTSLDSDNVDMILRSGDEDDEDMSTLPSLSAPSLSRLSPLLRNPVPSGGEDTSDIDHQIQATRSSDSVFSKGDKESSISHLVYDTSPPLVDDAADEEATRRALSSAQAYERKLLKSGHREIVSPLMVKRRLKPKVELSSRAQKKRPQLSERLSASSAPRFNFSGVVENKQMSEISTSLQKHADMKAKVHCGLPTCLSFNSKFIAVGTQLGIILIYDLFEVLRQRLGASGHDDNYSAKIAGSVTSLDLNFNGEMVIAGYAKGILVLWDTIRGIVLRSIHESHPSPITSVRFLADLKVVTVDAGGLVNKLTFTKNLIWSNYSVETECLLDGTAGQILAMNVLSPYWAVNPHLQPKKLGPVLHKLTLIALSSERSSFAVAVEPSISVLHRWARPPADRTDPISGSVDLPANQAYLPCLSWGWALVSGAGNVAMPMLARSWGCCLQFLAASFPTLEDGNTVATSEQATVHWPAFGVHDEIDATTPIVALEWLNNRTLVYLTITNEFTLVDTVMMTMLERLDFSGLRLVYAEFSLSRSASKDSEDGIDTAMSCTTFQNSIRCSDDRLIVLCQEELKCISIVGARRRVESLEEDGEWLEALALALDHYESTVISQEDRKRDQTGKKDLARHPEFSSSKNDEQEWIAKLLIRYMNLAVENAPESASDGPYSPGTGQAKIDLAQSHFQMLAGVCVEFCVVTRRLDLLFGPIFRRFESVGYTSVFLDVLEPYVLNDKLSYIAPEVMSYFVEHCKATNGVATVERCLLHMDCTIMDFDTIVTLLRANAMYTALIFVFNQGLDDFVTPLEILLERVFDEGESGHALLLRRKDGVPQNDFERLGYKAILYLQTCFKGKTFPQEKELLPEERQLSIRAELLDFLMQKSYNPSPNAKRPGERKLVLGIKEESYPYLRVMLQVDPRGMMDTLSLTIDAPNAAAIALADSVDSGDEWVNGESKSPSRSSRSHGKQETMDILASIILPELAESSKNHAQPQSAVNAFLDFAAKYIVQGFVRVDKSITFKIFSRLAQQFAAARDSFSRKASQKHVMDLLFALPRDAYDPDRILALIDNAGIHRAALLLHQQVASSWQETGSEDIDLRSRHFQSAIDCYLGDEDTDFRKEVFSYVRKECSGALNTYDSETGTRQKTLRDALNSKLPALVQLDALHTARLVAELFVDDLEHVVESLGDQGGREAQFLFLQAVISGDLVHLDPVAGSVLKLSMEHHHLYLSLMAKIHPEMVYEYLSTHDSYRAEDALKLCQEYEIADASAYLLERMGNVSSALQLILQTLEGRMMSLKRTIRGMGVDFFRQNSTRHFLNGNKRENGSAELPCKQEMEAEGVKRILIVALDLCERNSGTFATRSERGSQLWFNVLDRLINAKGFLRLSKEQPEHAKVMAAVLSELLRLTMQRMVSNVPLPDLVRKVTSDHSGSRLGDLREMVESLLGTYGFELTVFSSAADVFHQDVRSMQVSHRELQLEGAPVQTLMNIPLKAEASDNIASILRESSKRDAALTVNVGGNAVFVDTERLPYSQRAESGLASAISRLRSRRGKVDSSTLHPGHSAGLNMMTETEQLYQEGEIEPVVYGDRRIGALGDAEHRGRLMTFY